MAPSTAHCATLLPTNGAVGYDFVYLSEQLALLGQVSEHGQLRLQALPGPQRAAAVLGGRLYVFSEREAGEIVAAGQPRPLRRFAQPIRAAAPVGQRLALLMGGRRQGGHLCGAVVELWTPPGGPLSPAPQVKPIWNPCFLRPAADGLRLLVGVRKRAHFDAVVRLRPFLYRCARDTLEPVWKGTSFARPFEDAVLLEFASAPGTEACALEWAPDGRKLVTVYTWTDTTMEAVAASEPGRLGHTLQPVASEALGVFRRDGRRWQFVVLRKGNQRDGSGVQELQGAAAGPAFTAAPAAWTTVRTKGRTWLVTATAPTAATGPALTAIPVLP